MMMRQWTIDAESKQIAALLTAQSHMSCFDLLRRVKKAGAGRFVCDELLAQWQLASWQKRAHSWCPSLCSLLLAPVRSEQMIIVVTTR
jgi:hypothetical protein